MLDVSNRARAPEGHFVPEIDWPAILPDILDAIAQNKTLNDACAPHGVTRHALLKYVLDGGPREREYRAAQQVGLELGNDELRELDELALSSELVENSRGTVHRVPKLDPKVHATVVRNKQWRMERLNPKVYGRETKHTHDVSENLKARLDRLYAQQDEQRSLPDRTGEGVIDAEFSVEGEPTAR